MADGRRPLRGENRRIQDPWWRDSGQTGGRLYTLYRQFAALQSTELRRSLNSDPEDQGLASPDLETCRMPRRIRARDSYDGRQGMTYTVADIEDLVPPNGTI